MLFVSVGTEDTVILPVAYVPEEIAIWLLELAMILVISSGKLVISKMNYKK